jgi:hypothetical protein
VSTAGPQGDPPDGPAEIIASAPGPLRTGLIAIIPCSVFEEAIRPLDIHAVASLPGRLGSVGPPLG